MNKTSPKIPFAVLSDCVIDGIRRKIVLFASYDFVSEGYGIHNAELDFSVSRGDAGVCWSTYTGWYLEHLRGLIRGVPPLGADGTGSITLHSPVPLYVDHSLSLHHCAHTGGNCYTASYFEESNKLFDKIVADPEALWPELERRLVSLEAKIAQQRADARNFS